VLELGVFLSDFNTGGFTVKLDSRKVIRAQYDKTHISKHTYEQVLLRDFLVELAKIVKKRSSEDMDIHPAVTSKNKIHNIRD
jgi:indolepyruvate decarboxylase